MSTTITSTIFHRPITRLTFYKLIFSNSPTMMGREKFSCSDVCRFLHTQHTGFLVGRAGSACWGCTCSGISASRDEPYFAAFSITRKRSTIAEYDSTFVVVKLCRHAIRELRALPWRPHSGDGVARRAAGGEAFGRRWAKNARSRIRFTCRGPLNILDIL